MRPDHQGRGRRKPLRQDRGHDRGIREAEVQHRKPCAGSGRPSGPLVPRCYRRHLRPDPECHPRHLLPDGRFLLRPQALHAAGRSFCHARVRRKPYHRQGRQVPRDPVQGRHHRLRQDRHPDPRYPQGGQGRPLLRLQRERSFAAGRLPRGALPPLDGQRRRPGGQRARHLPRRDALRSRVYRGPRHRQPRQR